MVSVQQAALDKVERLAAHHKLQYDFAVLGGRESANRMAVELAIAQADAHVLQKAQQEPCRSCEHRASSRPDESHWQLQTENNTLRGLLTDSTLEAKHSRYEVARLQEENRRLKTRIRELRTRAAAHSDRRPHKTPEHPKPRHHKRRSRETINVVSPTAKPSLPPYTQADPTVSHGPTPAGQGQGRHEFDALLLADEILRQESNAGEMLRQTSTIAPPILHMACRSERPKGDDTNALTHLLQARRSSAAWTGARYVF